ncbi:MAG: hypothetical protein MUC46_06775 [Desulfobacterales bacterium]|nr:hypothetical protein [Desulfobacterales bacterium]
MDEKRLRAAAAAQAGPEGWRLLEGGGHVVLIRHALAPGFGDPANFKLGDCGTQRNLSEEGRRQARATAELAFGAFREQPALNSFFKQPALEAAQTRAMKELLAGHPPAAGNLILVTHQVNISALTGIVPDPGEMVVAAINERGALAPKARIRIAP